MHLLGGMALAYFIGGAGFRRRVCFLLTLAGALAWELAEAMSDARLGTAMTHGVADTLRDLLFGCLGAAWFLTVDAYVTESRAARSAAATGRSPRTEVR